MSEFFSEQEKIKLTPNEGFNLVGIDFFEAPGNRLYLIKHFDIYQEALKAQQDRHPKEDFFILYKGANGEYLSR